LKYLKTKIMNRKKIIPGTLLVLLLPVLYCLTSCGGGTGGSVRDTTQVKLAAGTGGSVRDTTAPRKMVNGTGGSVRDTTQVKMANGTGGSVRDTTSARTVQPKAVKKKKVSKD
jgi:hypothetical protein